MLSQSRALKTVLWKNYVLSRQQWPWIILELIAPVLFFALLSYSRANNPNLDKTVVNVSSSPLLDMKTIKSYLPSLGSWELWHAPTDENQNRIIEYLTPKLPIDSKDHVLNFDTRNELLVELKNYSGVKLVYAVIFENVEDQLNYTITVRKRYLEWNTHELYRNIARPSDNRDYDTYLHEGFLALQILINEAFIQMKLEQMSNFNISIKLQTISDHSIDQYKESQRFYLIILPLSIIFACCLPIALSIQNQMMHDQCSGMNDLMTISGVKMWVIIVGWLIQKTVMILLSSTFIALLLKVNIWGTPHEPIHYCQWSILLLFMVFYNFSAISYFLYLACACKTSSIGYVAGVITWIATYFLPTFIMHIESLSLISKICIAIPFPNVALYFGCKLLATYERAETTLEFSNLFSYNTLFDENNLPMGCVVIILLTSTIVIYGCSLIVYSIHTIYKKIISCLVRRQNGDEENIPLQSFNESKDAFVSIRHLRKKYGVDIVLNIPELDVNKGKITAVIGTNGAGKTTFISILTGATTSYSGSVIFNNTNQKDTQIGFCPQKDVLFEDLTVKENLLFFAQLRNRNDVSEILKDMGLVERENDKVCHLSTGLRRKLCLAMALVGNPEFIILDEPSGGVITEMQIVGENIKKRCEAGEVTVFITTHNSQEAEFLADNIVIMDKGEIVNSDTLTYSQLRRRNYDHYISLVCDLLSNRDEMEKQIVTNLPTTKILQRCGKEVVISFDGNSAQCVAYIKRLEEFKETFHIKRIAYNKDIPSNIFINYVNDDGSSDFIKNTDVLSRLSGLFEKRDFGFKTSILTKKWFFLKRKFYWHLLGLITTMLFAALVVIFCNEGKHNYSYNDPPISFNWNLYKNGQVFFSGIDESQVAHIMKLYANQSGDFNSNPVPDVASAIEAHINRGNILLEETNVAGVEFSLDNTLEANIIYSPRAYHSAPVAVNLAMNAILAIMNINSSIFTRIEPFHESYTDFSLNDLQDDNVFLLWSILLPLGSIFLVAGYIVFPNIESTTQFLRLHATNLKRLFWYWNLQLLFDTCLGVLLIVLLLLCILVLNFAFPLLGVQEFLILSVILFAYVFSKMPTCYAFGLLKSSDQGYTRFILFGIITGALPIVAYITKSFDSSEHTFVMLLACLLPQFSLGLNLFKFGRKFTENYNWDNMNPLVKNFICRSPSANPCCWAESAECFEHRSYFSNKNFGIQLNIFLVPVLTFSVWRCWLIYNSYHVRQWKQIFNRKPQRSVSTEAEIQKTSMEFRKLHFPGLNQCTKIPSQYQFKSNSLYGVLGANGTGKSLLLSTLTKENPSFKGDISLRNSKGDTLNINDRNYIKEIGYFPSSDKLMYGLTGRELLTLAGFSRGYNLNTSSKAAAELLDIFDLNSLADKRCTQYSGGKKKNLQICMAFMGYSNFIIIDDVGKSIDLSMKTTLWEFILAYKEFTHKTLILGMAHTENSLTLCDHFLATDGEHCDSNEMGYFKITFRLKSVDKANMSACKDIIKIMFAAWIETVDKDSKESSSRFFSVKLLKLKLGKHSLSDLVEKSEELKVTNPASIEDYSIIEI